MAYTVPSFLQPGVYAPPGSDLYNQRVAYNQSRGVPGGGAGVAAGGVETGIASSVNQFMQGQANLPFIMNLPGYQGMQAQQSQNILSMLQGDVPRDVINQILQQASERGIATGSPRGPNANAAYLKALGLTSIDLMGKGSELFGAAIEQTPRAELWNPMSLYVPERLAAQEIAAAKSGATSTGTSTSGSNRAWGTPSYTTENFFGGIW